MWLSSPLEVTPLTFILCALSCSALMKLRKHHNRGPSSAHINPTSCIPPFVICVIPHIISLKPYHITGFPPPPHTPNDFKSKSQADKHQRRTGVCVIAAGR